jgi:hypothetical protein
MLVYGRAFFQRGILMDWLFYYRTYCLVVFGIGGAVFVTSPVILSHFKKEDGDKVWNDLSLLFSNKDFLTTKGHKIRKTIRWILFVATILTAINIIVIKYLNIGG